MQRFIHFIGGFFLVILSSCSDKTEQNKPVVIRSTIQARPDISQPYVPVDQSPMDMCYYPPDYPILKMNGTDTNSLLARVIYSRPQKKGRQIFGDSAHSLVLYGKEWRLGANEATEIEFFKPVTILGKRVDRGRYVMYCIPHPDTWRIVLNSNLHTWGLHMETDKDLLSFDIPVQEQSPMVEYFTMEFMKATNGTDLMMTWENVKAFLPVRLLGEQKKF